MGKLTSIVCAECTEQATENHQDTSDHDGNLAAPSISDEGPIQVSALPLYLLQETLHKRKTSKTTNLVDCIHQSQLGATGCVEVRLPRIQILGGVKHHSARCDVSSIHTQSHSYSAYPSYPVVAEATQSTAAQKYSLRRPGSCHQLTFSNSGFAA